MLSFYVHVYYSHCVLTAYDQTIRKQNFLDIMEVISHDISNILFKCIVGYYRATWVTFKPKLEKIKIFTIGKFLIFQEMKLSSSKIKNYLTIQ